LKALPGDESILPIIQDEPFKPEEIISTKVNSIPDGLTPLESSFLLSVGGDEEKHKEEELQWNVVKTIYMSIRTPEPSMNVKINIQGYDKERMRSVELLGMDPCGFDIGLVQHTMKSSRKKQGLVNFSLKETFLEALRDF